MKTNPTVSRFADREKITIQPNTRIEADEEASSYEFTVISRGHYACTNGDTIHTIIERNGTIGCSCSDMTYRRRDNDVCKHITARESRRDYPAPHAITTFRRYQVFR